MRDLAPDIFRQRLLLEGYYSGEMTAGRVNEYLLGAAAHLGLRTYAPPIVFSPAEGMGREENAGFDAFVPLIDSGISAYIWSQAAFFSVLLYTCKGFDEKAAAEFTRDFFGVGGELASQSF
jgi:S-adenosylmethionine decarboxylase